MKKSVIVLEVEHENDIPALGNMIAGRAYTIAGVTNVEFVADFAKVPVLDADQLLAMGFKESEISLGAQDVERG